MAVLANDRVGLGVGLSWMPEEFRYTRTDMKTRGKRADEMIDILRLVCGGGGPKWVEYHGKHYDFDRLMISPAPEQPVPISVGGLSEPALRRAARLADGFFPQRPLEGGWPATLERMQAWREAAGKSWDGYGIEARINAGTGTSDDWRQTLEEWTALGATHITVNTMNGGLKGPDEHIARIREVKDALG